jgi:hypothetical protein
MTADGSTHKDGDAVAPASVPDAGSAAPSSAATVASTVVATPAAVPAGPSERLYRWVDVINKLFQIAGIIVVDVWTYGIFKLVTAPGLQPKTSITTELLWKSIDRPDVCLAQVVATVKNPGLVRFEITSANLTVRVHDLAKIDPGTGRPFFFPQDQHNPTLIEPERMTKIDPATIDRNDVGLLNSDLVHSYPPGLENSSSQYLLFQKFDTGLAIIQVDVYGWASSFLWFGKQDLHDYSYAIGRVCEDVKQTTGDKTSAQPPSTKRK